MNVVTLNALRRFLRDSGCIEERCFSIAGGTETFFDYRCTMKSGRECRATFAVDTQAGSMPATALSKLQRRLAPCLGVGWLTRVPEDNPFG